MMKQQSGKRKQQLYCFYCSSESIMSILPSRGRRDLVRTHRTLNTTSCSHRVAFVWASGKLLDEKVHLSAAIVYSYTAIVCGSATIVWPSVGFVFASATDWLLTKIGATFARNSKIHIRVSIYFQIRESVTPAWRRCDKFCHEKRFVWRATMSHSVDGMQVFFGLDIF